MTILISVAGFVARFAGTLLTTSLGWASSLLFGRVQRSHQIFVTLMLAGALTWIVLVVCAIAPIVSDTMFDVTPHPASITRTLLRAAILAGVAIVPLGVGLAAFLVPSDGERPTGPGIPIELLRGYILTPLLAGLLLFLPAVGISRKVRSVRHGWADTHIPIVVKPKGYDQTVVDLAAVLEEAGLAVRSEDAPAVLSAPAWLLTRVAGSNVARLRPDRLVELKGPRLRIGVYPSDVAISGPSPERGRARSAILMGLADTSAYLTTSAEAQSLEDLFAHVQERLTTSTSLTPAEVVAECAEIDETLANLKVSDEEWEILYRLRLQMERDVLVELVDGGAVGVGRSPFAQCAAGRLHRSPSRARPRGSPSPPTDRDQRSVRSAAVWSLRSPGVSGQVRRKMWPLAGSITIGIDVSDSRAGPATTDAPCCASKTAPWQGQTRAASVALHSTVQPA